MGKGKLSKAASLFIARHVKKHRDEGMAEAQAVAAAYSEARKHGFKVPRKG